MKKLNFNLIVVLFSLIIVSTGYSQTADELIVKYAEAMGGEDKLMAIKSVQYTGKFSGNGADIPMVMIAEREGKARMEMTYQGMNLIRACENNSGWMINPFQGNKEAEKLPPEEVKNMKKHSELEGELINYKQKGYKVEFLGKEDFEGSEVFKVKLTDNDGDITYYFLDATSYLILKDNSKRKIGEKEITAETLYGNYQKVDGIMFPMSIEFREVGSDQGQKVTIEKIETNVKVDESIFKMPVTK